MQTRAPIKSYRDLVVWQRSLDLVTDVYRVTAQFPRDERFGAIAQMRRAALSIPLNIAEGHGRTTRGEYRNQLSVACGSVNEVQTICTIGERLGFANADALRDLQRQLDVVQRMLIRLVVRLSEKQKGPQS